MVVFSYVVMHIRYMPYGTLPAVELISLAYGPVSVLIRLSAVST